MIQQFAFLVGQTPWSARVYPDPPIADTSKPTRASAADPGVCPTLNVDLRDIGKLNGVAHKCVCHGHIKCR